MGDSNLQHLPPILLDHVQVDCYPGATLNHAFSILNRLVTPTLHVKQVLLAFGFQNRSTVTDTAIEQARTMHVRATTAFPHASIWIPLINTAPGLPREEKDNVVRLNHFFTTISSTIPLLPEHQFQTTADHIFWTPPTGQAILAHWSNFLNLGGSSAEAAPVERKGLINLSSHFRPTPAQVSLLLKGLSFVPTLNMGDRGPPSMRLEIAAYHRRLKLAALFEGEAQSDPNERRRFLPPQLGPRRTTNCLPSSPYWSRRTFKRQLFSPTGKRTPPTSHQRRSWLSGSYASTHTLSSNQPTRAPRWWSWTVTTTSKKRKGNSGCLNTTAP